MSNIFGAPKALEESRSVPTGDTVGSYTSYLDAQKAVDYLADQQFPVQLVSIVGNDLKMVERVTGRLSYPRVALSGALSGMWFGLFVGVMLSFFSPTGGYFSIVTSVLMGAAFFMLFGIVTYATQRGKRDFTSTSQVVATNYDVIVAFEAAQEARRLLHQLPMTPADASSGPGGYTQQDHRQGPFQQPGPGPENGPERPSGWSDPYGQRQQAGGPGYQAGQAPSRPTPSSRYPDLPDGRPQYGLRVEDQAQAPGQAEPGHPAPGHPAPGNALPHAQATSGEGGSENAHSDNAHDAVNGDGHSEEGRGQGRQ
ncbi:general stress protein [Arthrobacter sp. M4]|uniref:general stress protein n=1 Tax=Arthrobacter sp. M4 TaxID=218160 RepID=UPI001CDD4B1D|nr:general stress protein [Arthrobacter sp. M4]MCA4132358.1 ECF transporter S component [Arthrobacter sp. M4]